MVLFWGSCSAAASATPASRARQLAISPNAMHYNLIQSPPLTEVATAFLMQ